MNSAELKQFIRQPYAWPGGYPMFLLLSDGGAICHCCAKKEFKLILSSLFHNYRDGWNPCAVDVNWEDSELYCDHCNKLIESAYA